MGFLSRGHIEKRQKPVNLPMVTFSLENPNGKQRVDMEFTQLQPHPRPKYMFSQDVANSDWVKYSDSLWPAGHSLGLLVIRPK